MSLPEDNTNTQQGVGGVGITSTPATPPNTTTPVNNQKVMTPAEVLANIRSVQAPTFAPRTIAQNETASGQMTGLLDANGRYIQQARNDADIAQAGRGMLHSSQAAGASEREAIKAAMPMATQDAGTYATAAMSAQNANENAGIAGYQAGLLGMGNTQTANDTIAKQNAQQANDLQKLNIQESGYNARNTENVKATNENSIRSNITSNTATYLDLYNKTMSNTALSNEAKNNLISVGGSYFTLATGLPVPDINKNSGVTGSAAPLVASQSASTAAPVDNGDGTVTINGNKYIEIPPGQANFNTNPGKITTPSGTYIPYAENYT